MKKENLTVLGISFAIIYLIIAALCILNGQPLIFPPVQYDVSQFLALFILLGFLSVGLILVMDNLEKLYKEFLTSNLTTSTSIYSYFILTSGLGLFAFTLIAGFIESGFSPLFYYGCVGNSCLYLIGSYSVTTITAIYFAYRLIRTKRKGLEERVGPNIS